MKIIICKGTANIPARFWCWIVCEEEFTKDIKNQGFVKSECTKYLSREQLNFLND